MAKHDKLVPNPSDEGDNLNLSDSTAAASPLGQTDVPGTDGATLVVDKSVREDALQEQQRIEEEDDRPILPDPTATVDTPSAVEPLLPSSKTFPNAHADAEAMFRQRLADRDGPPAARRSFRADPDATGPRTAYDLAKFLEAYPTAMNYLDRLDQFEREVAGVLEPEPWERNPVDMAEEAKRHNFYFIESNGNMIPAVAPTK